jgi:hypothetical protein
LNVRRGATQHLTRFLADGKGLIRPHVLGDDGRLAQYDALPAHIDEDVGGS